uniref:Uncharacterized protein n=1 Tax=Oreochromis aureus TaxID=47969 RepID=A0A668RH05_OREAU
MRKRDIATALLTMTQSGRSISFRRWQALVVTELAPAHHSIENSQRSLTTYRFTVMFRLRRSLSNTKTSASDYSLTLHCKSLLMYDKCPLLKNTMKHKSFDCIANTCQPKPIKCFVDHLCD